jgi:S-DNA-T family DNA segregation ATPase FtsK/SpoIIIE
VDGAASWRPGQQVAVGDTLLDLVPYEQPDAALNPAGDGAGLEFNRPPRLLPPGVTIRFQLPAPPGRPERRPVPVLMAVVPVLLGVGMAYFLRQVSMLAMAAFSPVMLLGSYVSDRRGGRKSHARQLAEYREHKDRVEREAAEAADAERLHRRATARTRPPCCASPPAQAAVVGTPPHRPGLPAAPPGHRRPAVRRGADRPAADEHRRRRYWLIPDAPVTIPLAGRGWRG